MSARDFGGYAAGLSIKANGDQLVVWPAERLTDDLRELILTHKPDLLAKLACSSTEPASATANPSPAMDDAARQWVRDYTSAEVPE